MICSAQAKTGKGALGRLINDKQIGDNLAAFIANLKAHGPIFYNDDTADKRRRTTTTRKKEINERTSQRGRRGGGSQPAHGL